MNFSALSKTGFAASLLCATLAGWSTVVQAGTLQDTIFAKVESSSVNRMFVRLSHINVNIKTTSKDAYDVTGPVISGSDYDLLQNQESMFLDDLGNSLETEYYGPTNSNGDVNIYRNGFLLALRNAGRTCPNVATGLGTPCGIKARSESRVATQAVSLGYFLSNERTWAVEAFVLASPVKATVYGDGPNKLNGKSIIETKLLPPIVTLGRYFGSPDGGFRPFLGMAVSYAVFYDTKATNALNVYQGGGVIGDTTAKVGNTFGWGPMLGLSFQPKASDWGIALSVGKIRFKTEATLTTRNTVIVDGADVLSDFPIAVQNTLRLARNGIGNVTPKPGVTVGGYTDQDQVPFITALMCDLAKLKQNNTECNQGTFVRKAENVLDNTLVMLSVTKSF